MRRPKRHEGMRPSRRANAIAWKQPVVFGCRGALRATRIASARVPFRLSLWNGMTAPSKGREIRCLKMVERVATMARVRRRRATLLDDIAATECSSRRIAARCGSRHREPRARTTRWSAECSMRRVDEISARSAIPRATRHPAARREDRSQTRNRIPARRRARRRRKAFATQGRKRTPAPQRR